MHKSYIYLILAIFAEVMATSLLKLTEGFKRPLFTFLVLSGYGTAFYFLSLTLKYIPVGIVYAIWSGVGIVGILIIQILLYKEIPDLPALIGIGCILIGVVIIHLFSKNVPH